MQEGRNSGALAIELRLSCTNPSIWQKWHVTLANLINGKLMKRAPDIFSWTVCIKSYNIVFWALDFLTYWLLLSTTTITTEFIYALAAFGMLMWKASWPEQWVAENEWDSGAHGSKLASASRSNSFIIGINPAAIAQIHVLHRTQILCITWYDMMLKLRWLQCSPIV